MNPVIRNIFWLLAEHGSRIILSTLSVSLMARALGVEQYGLLQYTLGLVAAFSSISFICGAEVLVPPLVTATPAERKRLLGNAFVLRQAASVVAYICLLIFAWVAEDRGNFLLVAVTGISILFSESFAVVTAWLQSQTNIKPRSILAFFALLCKIALVVVLYKSNTKSVILFALVYLTDAIIIAIGLLVIYHKENGGLFFFYEKTTALNLLKKGYPFFAGLIIMFFYQRLDIIMLKRFSNLYNTGIYAAAMQLMFPISAIASMLSMSLAPHYIYRQHDEKTALKNIGLITIAMFAIGLILAACARLTGGFILHSFFGKKFNDAIPIFNLLIWSTVLIFTDSALNLLLIKKQKAKHIAIKWIFALATSGVVHLTLIPEYHAKGAIAGYIIGYIATCSAGLFFYATEKTNISLQA